MNQKLKDYNAAVQLIDEVDDELYTMTTDFFQGCGHSYTFERFTYDKEDGKSELVVSCYYAEDTDYYTYMVSNEIIDDYFAGKKKEAVIKFKEFLIEDTKRREQERLKAIEEAKQKAAEARKKAEAEAEWQEYQLYKKLKEKYEVKFDEENPSILYTN